MPTLHLQLCAGFANRVRAMISGICLAEDLNANLVLHWFPRSVECVCSLKSVLDPESLPKTCKVVPDELYNPVEVLSPEDLNRFFHRWDKTSDIEIKSYGIFYTNERWEEHLRRLRPSPMVKEVLERRTALVDWPTAIGVHIRRTDNKKSIEGSPLESFLKKMREDMESTYVIATDDKEVRKQLEEEFIGRCFFPSFVLSRRTEEGMVHGAADFFALSKCSQIWGSYASSYSEIASRYGNNLLTIV